MSGPRTTILVLWSVILPTVVAFAGDAGRETPFTSLGAGARSLGMGGGFTALTADAWAIHYNPSGLAWLDYQEFSFMHSILFEGTTYDCASWAYPISENHGLGGGIMRLGTDDIIRRVDFADRGRFDFAYTQMLLAYGRHIGERMSAGLAIKILHQSLDNKSDFGVGLDLGFSARLRDNLVVGAVVLDLVQPEFKLLDRPEKNPMAAAAGLCWKDLPLSEQIRLALSLDVERLDGRDLKVRAGTEAVLHDVLAVRLGFDRDNLTLGMGVKYRRINIDYAYKLVDYVDDIHHISVSFLVGPSTAERIRRRELALLPPEPTEEEKRFAALMDTANRFFRRFQLDSAGVYFRQALEMQPDNEEIIGTLAAIEDAKRVQREQEEALRAARDDASQTLRTFVAQAEQLLSRKMYRAALDLLSLIFDIDPANLEANVLRNRILNARDAELSEAMGRARLAAEQAKWFDAVEAYNRVLELDPENQAAVQAKRQILAAMDLPERLRLAIELFDRGEFTEARARFEAILEVNPNESIAQEYLRRIREQRAAQPPATLEDLQKDRVYWELYLEGLRHMRNKDYQKAIEAWEKVLQAYPNNVNTINNIEQARLRLGTQNPGN
jgi:tetratricopeptide (TPR) repeat protein